MFGFLKRARKYTVMGVATDGDAKLTKLAENNVFVANEHAEVIRQKTDAEAAAYVKSIFDMYDVVWGVWNDPNGVGMFPLKGDVALRQAIASGQTVTLKMSAVLCTAEEGIAALAASQCVSLPDGLRRFI